MANETAWKATGPDTWQWNGYTCKLATEVTIQGVFDVVLCTHGRKVIGTMPSFNSAKGLCENHYNLITQTNGL